MDNVIKILFILAFSYMGTTFAILVAGRKKRDKQTIEDQRKEIDALRNKLVSNNKIINPA
jgi:hypothetical protein